MKKEQMTQMAIEAKYIYKGFAIFKCTRYYYYNKNKEVITIYRIMLGTNEIYYSSMKAAKAAITRRINKIKYGPIV